MTLEELVRDYKLYTHEQLRNDGWVSVKDLIELGIPERTARFKLDANSTDKRFFKVAGHRNRVCYYKLKA